MSNRSRSQKRSGSNDYSSTKSNSKAQQMMCVCIPADQIKSHMNEQCTCGVPMNQGMKQEMNKSKSRKGPQMSSTRINFEDLDESVYEEVQNTSILEIPDEPENAYKLGLMYRTDSFR